MERKIGETFEYEGKTYNGNLPKKSKGRKSISDYQLRKGWL